MGTFGNLRPCSFAAPSLVDISPLKADVCRGVNFNIIRELTGGIYFGDRKEDNGDGFAMDTEPYSRVEIERITRLAAHLALQHDPPLPVWSLDKANVLATSRLWRKVVTEVITNEFPQLKLGHHLIDSAAMLMIKDPRKLNGIVVTSNLFGDIISDEASVIPGSLGLLPSASLTGIPDGKNKVNGIYEPIHGMCLFSFLTSLLLETNFLYILTEDRICPRYRRKRHCQPRRRHLVHGNVASILYPTTRRGTPHRRSSPKCYRGWYPNRRHWRKVDYC